MLFLFFKMFKRFEKVVRGGKNRVKWGKNGVKRLTQNPHTYTTHERRHYIFIRFLKSAYEGSHISGEFKRQTA